MSCCRDIALYCGEIICWHEYPTGVLGNGTSGGEERRSSSPGAAIGYDGEIYYLGLALDVSGIEGFVEGYLEWIGKNDPEEEQLCRDPWEDETQREVVLDGLKAACEIKTGDLQVFEM